VLLEHYAGAFPTWLSPVQAAVLPVRDDNSTYALEVATNLRALGARVSVEDAGEPLGTRIRKAKLEKIPFVLVVGAEDVEAGTVGVNARGSAEPERGVPVEEFATRLKAEIAGPGSLEP
jgi:threonyl-tRNA synthetase